MTERKLGVLVHGAGWVSTQHIAATPAGKHVVIEKPAAALRAVRKLKTTDKGPGWVC